MAKMYRLFTNWAAREQDGDQGIFEQDFPATDAGIDEIAECLLEQEICLEDDIMELLDLEDGAENAAQEVRGWLRTEIEKIAEHNDHEGDIKRLNEWDIIEIEDPLPDLQAQVTAQAAVIERLRECLQQQTDYLALELEGLGEPVQEIQRMHDNARALLTELGEGQGG